MHEYLVTFHTHFASLRFKRFCQKAGYSVQLMPVPRSLSSSCGTCASYQRAPLTLETLHSQNQLVLPIQHNSETAIELLADAPELQLADIDQILRVQDDNYLLLANSEA